MVIPYRQATPLAEAGWRCFMARMKPRFESETPIQKVREYLKHLRRGLNRYRFSTELQMTIQGWDRYARKWNPAKCPALPGARVECLGDEWTAEDHDSVLTTYGLSREAIGDFAGYLTQHLLDPYLPPDANEGLEIGPGGGRLTALLVNRTGILHVADSSHAMLRHLRSRFAHLSTLRYFHTDGMTLPALPRESLDYVISFDVFVHFEPRLVFWYLRQISTLLRPGGTGIIHYANVLPPIGWQEFEQDLEANVQGRTSFGAFGVMCPQLMEKFLAVLGFTIISIDAGVIPRDAIAVFRRPGNPVGISDVKG